MDTETYVKYFLRHQSGSGTITFYVPDDNSSDVRIVFVDAEHETNDTQTMNLADARELYVEKIREGYLLHSTDRSNSKDTMEYSPYKEYFSENPYSHKSNVIKKEDFEIAMEVYEWTKRIKENVYEYEDLE
tara:strand:+ start:590 stop:982 length:393 start_codon:yes stop_codon:yes gene_type:complete